MRYKSLRCHLEYANSVWNPHQIQFIEALDKVQMRATKLIFNLRNKSFEEKLRILDRPTLKYRRLRSDMIETYKILSGKYDVNVCISSHSTGRPNLYTRSITLKICNRRTHYDIRKYFCNRITNIWNSLPIDIVTAPTLYSFKSRLDKHWLQQDIKYNWESELTGTGSRSCLHVCLLVKSFDDLSSYLI